MAGLRRGGRHTHNGASVSWSKPGNRGLPARNMASGVSHPLPLANAIEAKKYGRFAPRGEGLNTWPMLWSSARNGAHRGTKKGKDFVDWLSERADVGRALPGAGHNAGHTLVVDGKGLQAVASAFGRRAVGGNLSVIGNGVVFDPHAFVSEVTRLRDPPPPPPPPPQGVGNRTALP